jgi:O-antigen/teichoic acid export membrane protein
MRDLYSFGLKMFFKSLLVYSSDNVDYFVVGKRLGAVALGFYERAFRLMDLAVVEVSVKQGAVLFSAFSRLQDSRSRLLAAYNKVMLTISLATYPLFFGLVIVAPSFIHVVFGEKWLPSVVPLQIMCLAGVMRVQLQVASTLINAMGKVSGEIWQRAAALLLLAIGCWVGSQWGIVGVSAAVTVVAMILTSSLTCYLGRITGLTWTDLMRPQIPALAASSVMAAVALAYQRWAEPALGIHSATMLVSSTAVGVASYAMALWALRPGPVVALLKEFLGQFRSVAERLPP